MVPVPDQRLGPSADRAMLPKPRRRLVVVAMLIALGYAIARHVVDTPSAWWLASAAGLALLGAVLPRRWRTLALALGAICFASGWFTLRIWETPPNSLSRALNGKPTILDVEGVVVSEVRTPARRGMLAPLLPRDPSTTFLLDVRAMIDLQGEPVPASGALRVFLRGDLTHDLAQGDVLRARGMATGLDPPSNPGQIDGRLHARMRHQVGMLEVDSPALLERLEPAGFSLARTLHRAQGALRTRASRWLDLPDDHDPRAGESPSRALLRALALGQREASLSEVDLLFQRTGLAHILAVSGLHLMVLVGLVALGLRALGARPWVELVVLVMLIGAYVALVPARGPIVRAAIMALVLFGAGAGGRRYDRVTILALAAIVVLLWRPLELWSMGFQLSFGVVAGLLTLTTPLRNRLFGADEIDPDHRTARQFASARAKDALASSLCAWLIATPIVMHHVGIVAPLAVITVLFVMPIVTLLLALAFAASAVSVVAPTFGATLASPLQALAGALIDLVIWFDRLPGSTIHLPSISPWWTLLALGTIVLLIRARVRLGAMFALASAGWLTFTLLAIGLPRDQALRLDTFDVGDGSCHLLRRGKEAILYDCGSLKLDMGERDLPRALRAVGVWRVPRVIVSHANIDHFAAVVDLLEPLGVEEVLLGPSVEDDARDRPGGAAAIVLDALRERGVAMRTLVAGDSLDLAGATLDVLSPGLGEEFTTPNDRSLVLLARAPTSGRERRVLLTGDIQRDAMRALRARIDDLDVDILEAPHHGSAHPEAYGFVRWLEPEVVVQSTGPRRLGDPRWDDVRAECTWLVTAGDGAISVMVGDDGEITTRTWRAGPLPDPRWRLRPIAD